MAEETNLEEKIERIIEEKIDQKLDKKVEENLKEKHQEQTKDTSDESKEESKLKEISEQVKRRVKGNEPQNKQRRKFMKTLGAGTAGAAGLAMASSTAAFDVRDDSLNVYTQDQGSIETLEVDGSGNVSIPEGNLTVQGEEVLVEPDVTDENYYATSVSGDGNSELTISVSGADDISTNLSHDHTASEITDFSSEAISSVEDADPLELNNELHLDGGDSLVRYGPSDAPNTIFELHGFSDTHHLDLWYGHDHTNDTAYTWKVGDGGDSRDIAFLNYNDDTFVFMDAGNSNVGIGTQNPSSKLDVDGEISEQGNRVATRSWALEESDYTPVSDVESTSSINLNQIDVNADSQVSYTNDHENQAIYMPFQGSEGEARTYMSLAAVTTNNTDNVEAPATIAFHSSTSDNYAAHIGGYRNDQDGGDPSFGIWLANNQSLGDANEVLTAKSTGSSESNNRVGISNRHPSYKLDVSGNARITQGLRIEGSTRHDWNGITCGTSNSGHLMLDSNGGNLYLNYNENEGVYIGGDDVELADDNQNVGVGVGRNASAQLDVGGNINLNDNSLENVDKINGTDVDELGGTGVAELIGFATFPSETEEDTRYDIYENQFDILARNGEVLNIFLNETTQNEVTNHTTAMQQTATHQPAMDELTPSTTAMQTIANTQTAMNIIANSITALQAISTSQTAMEEIANSETALNEIKEEWNKQNLESTGSHEIQTAPIYLVEAEGAGGGSSSVGGFGDCHLGSNGGDTHLKSAIAYGGESPNECEGKGDDGTYEITSTYSQLIEGETGGGASGNSGDGDGGDGGYIKALVANPEEQEITAQVGSGGESSGLDGPGEDGSITLWTPPEPE